MPPTNLSLLTMSITHKITLVQPYLFFEGRCDEALQFYRQTLGAEILFLMRYQESPAPPEPGPCAPPDGEKVMHASLRIGEAVLMASDGRCGGATCFKGFSLSLSITDEAEARRIFAALTDGGHVIMPLTKTFFSPLFGMVTDRFGVTWMIILPSATA